VTTESLEFEVGAWHAAFSQGGVVIGAYEEVRGVRGSSEEAGPEGSCRGV
jgi:hypothetical protein